MTARCFHDSFDRRRGVVGAAATTSLPGVSRAPCKMSIARRDREGARIWSARDSSPGTLPRMPEPVSTDPNWLLSTTAQSAAALIAIVGGFLVSRLVSLGSEKQALERRLAELQGRYGIVRGRLQDVYEDRHAVSVDWLEDLALNEMVRRDAEITVDEIIEEFTPRGATADEMREAAEDLLAAVRRVLAIVQGTGATTELGLIGKQHGYGPLDDRDKRILKEVHDQRSSSGALIARVAPRIGVAPEVERQDRRIEHEQQLDAEVRALAAEAHVVKAQLRLLSTPPRLKLAVFVLVYFAVVSVVVPLYCMTRRPVPDGPLFRLAIVLLFVSGLGALLYYVSTSIGGLKWADPEVPTPELGTGASSPRVRAWRQRKADRTTTDTTARQ